MSVTAAAARPPRDSRDPRDGRGVTLPRVIRSEWTKLWSLRSTRWSLALACLFMVGLGPLVAALEMARWNQLTFIQRLTLDPIGKALAGSMVAMFCIGVLGVMTITGEYSTGSIRSTLMAVPRRLPMLWAKLIVFGITSLVLMLATAVIGYLISQSIFSQHHVNVALGTAPAPRELIGSVLLVTATGLFCAALGTIIRSTPGAISTYVGVMYILPPFITLLPTDLQTAINRWLPLNAGEAVTKSGQLPNLFSPWAGFGVFCGYTAILLAVAAYLLNRRDA